MTKIDLSKSKIKTDLYYYQQQYNHLLYHYGIHKIKDLMILLHQYYSLKDQIDYNLTTFGYGDINGDTTLKFHLSKEHTAIRQYQGQFLNELANTELSNMNGIIIEPVLKLFNEKSIGIKVSGEGNSQMLSHYASHYPVFINGGRKENSGYLRFLVPETDMETVYMLEVFALWCQENGIEKLSLDHYEEFLQMLFNESTDFYHKKRMLIPRKLTEPTKK